MAQSFLNPVTRGSHHKVFRAVRRQTVLEQALLGQLVLLGADLRVWSMVSIPDALVNRQMHFSGRNDWQSLLCDGTAVVED